MCEAGGQAWRSHGYVTPVMQSSCGTCCHTHCQVPGSLQYSQACRQSWVDREECTARPVPWWVIVCTYASDYIICSEHNWPVFIQYWGIRTRVAFKAATSSLRADSCVFNVVSCSESVFMLVVQMRPTSCLVMTKQRGTTTSTCRSLTRGLARGHSSRSVVVTSVYSYVFIAAMWNLLDNNLFVDVLMWLIKVLVGTLYKQSMAAGVVIVPEYM